MSPKADDPAQEQFIRARKNQILDAAVHVFAEKGFQRATIRDVATKAGIADGTIYNYFTNKSALLLGILDRLNETDERPAQFEHGMGVDPQIHMVSYIRQRLETISEGGDQIFQALLPEVLINPELREQYNAQIVQPTYQIAEKYFREWIEQGAIRPLDVPLMLRAISGMFLGIFLLRLIGDSELKTRWDQVPDFTAQLLLHGILPDKDKS